MNAMARQLRETYQVKDTEELIELAGKTTLTDTAYTVLDEILTERGVDLESVKKLHNKNAETEKAEEEAMLRLASIPRRFAAKIIDTWGLVIFIGIPLTMLDSVIPESTVFSTSFLIIFWVYFLFSDGMFGQSIGKRIMNIKVVKYGSNKSCTFGQSFWRNLSEIFIIDWLFALGKKRMRLGDMIANTQVINAR